MVIVLIFVTEFGSSTNSVFLLDQTVAVIPVLPHGVVQFGSFMTVSSTFHYSLITEIILNLRYSIATLVRWW